MSGLNAQSAEHLLIERISRTVIFRCPNDLGIDCTIFEIERCDQIFHAATL